MTEPHKLVKTLIYDVQYGSRGDPGSPGQPYRPAQAARCYYTPPAVVCETRELMEYLEGPAGPLSPLDDTVYVWNNSRPVEVCESLGTRVCVGAVPEQPFIPATPPTEASLTTVRQDFNIGWNGRAKSIEAFDRQAVVFSFRASVSIVGAFVGVSGNHQDTGYGDIRYGYMLRHGQYKPVSGGVASGAWMDYGEESDFEILLTSEYATMTVTGSGHDASDVHTFSSVETLPLPLVLSTSFYMAQDYIHTPDVGYASEGVISLPSVRSIGGEGTFQEGAAISLPSFEVPSYAYSHASLPAVVSLASNYGYGVSTSQFPAMTGEAFGGLIEFTVAVGVARFPAIAAQATGLTGEVGGQDVVLPSVVSVASEGSYGASFTTTPPFVSYAHAYEGAYSGSVYSFTGATGDVTATSELFVLLDASGSVAGAITGTLYADASLPASISAADSITTLLAVFAELAFTVEISGQARTVDLGDYDIWVMNKDTYAVTRYEQFNFLSAATFGEYTYGVRDDGVYKLHSDTDGGNPIEASVHLGETNFNTSALKRIDSCYIGASSDGDLYLRITANGNTYTYAARNVDSVFRTQRVDVGRGLKVSYMGFELVNSAGSDFEFEGVEFVAVPLTRRIR